MMTYSSRAVCALADVTYRQLDHWIHSGYIDGQPATVGSGTARIFTEDHLARVRALAAAAAIKQMPLPDLASRLNVERTA